MLSSVKISLLSQERTKAMTRMCYGTCKARESPQKLLQEGWRKLSISVVHIPLKLWGTVGRSWPAEAFQITSEDDSNEVQ